MYSFLIRFYRYSACWVEQQGKYFLPLLSRFLFAALLFPFFWRSAQTKFSEGFPFPSDGAYIQIFPKALEAAGYDTESLGFIYHLVVFIGSYAEFILPLFIVLGVFGRLSALGMLCFIGVMTLTDIYAHGVMVGQWFNGDPSELIADQRSLWVLLLISIVSFGSGWLSIDQIARRFLPKNMGEIKDA